MKLIKKKRLKRMLMAAIATVSLHIVTSGFGLFDMPCVHAADGTSDSASNNTVTVNEDTYKINDGDETKFSENNYDLLGRVIGNIYSGFSSPNKSFNDFDIIGGQYTSGNCSYNIINWNGLNLIYPYYTYGGYNESNGDAIENIINFQKGTAHRIIGGYTSSGNAEYNTINIENGELAQVFGGYSITGNSNHNNVIISGGNITNTNPAGHIYGGFSEYGAASYNNIEVTNGTINEVIGGSSYDGNISFNEVEISGGNIDNVYGAFGEYNSHDKDEHNTFRSNAEGNIVTINNGKIDSYVYGARIEENNKGYSIKNVVNINGGVVHAIVGGYAHEGNAENNIVNVNNGCNIDGVIGGSSFYGNAENNEVTIKDNATVNAEIRGGYSTNGDAINNTINIYNNPDLSSAFLYGGYSLYGTSSGNTLNIYTKGLIAQNISDFQNINFYLPSNIANDDKVLTLTNGKTDISGVDRIYAQVPGDTSLTNGNKVYLIHNNNGINGEATNNYAEMAVGVSTQYTVKIEKSSDGNSVLMLVGDAEESNDSGNSGSSNNGNSGSSDSGNSGSDNGNNSSNTSGDSSSDSGNSGSSDNGNSGSDNGNSSSDNSSTTNNTASNNVITVNDSNYTIKHADDAEQTSDYNGNRNNVIGGQVGSNLSNSDIVGGTSDSGDSTNNQITINAGTFNQDIKGGYAPGNSASDNTINIRGGHFNGDIIGGEGSTTNNNTIDISGNPTFSNNTIIYGGKINNSSRNYVEGGYIEKGDEIANESSGNTLNIRSVGLTAQNIGNFNNLNFYIPESATNGDTMLTLSDTSGTDLSNTSIKAGVTGDSYLQTGDRVNLLTNENGLTTTGTSYGQLTAGVSADFDVAVAQAGNSIVATITRKTTNPETRIFDIPPIEVPHLLNKGTDQLIHDFDFDDINPQEMPNQNSFLLNSGGHNDRIKTGSGSILRSRGTNHNLGYARSFKNSAGTFTIIPVVEYGHGSYDTYLSNDMHGDGSAKYVAGGFIARQFNNSGLYYEGSFRAGRSEFDFGSSGFENYDRVSYKTHAPVFASHLRLGYLTKINPKNILHVYGIYSYSRQNSMDAHLSSGETYSFDSIDSNRLRAGYKWTSKVSPISYVYTGMAYMYESNPNSNAMYKNQNLRVPKAGASGSSGMLELGWQIRPLKNNPWMVDINTTGWIGHQKGITALAKIKKAF